MKKHYLLFLLSFWGLQELKAQELVVDPVTSAAIAVDAAVIDGQLKTTNDNLSLISKGQLAVSGQLVIVNDLQHKIYQGLSQVATVIGNLQTVKEIADCGRDIVSDIDLAVSYARQDPALLLFTTQGSREFQARASALSTEVSAFVLTGGAGNLMDSGERAKLLNHIASEMRILRGIAYGMQRAMYWAKLRGVFRTLNPLAAWQSMDIRIANDIITHAKYLKP